MIAREGHLDQLAVWQLEGTWKPAVLAEWAGNQKAKVLAGEPIDWKALPRQIAAAGRVDARARRSSFLTAWNISRVAVGGKGGRRSMADTIATLEFFEVRLGGQIPPQRFVFQPGNRTTSTGPKPI